MTAQDVVNISPQSIQSLATQIAERERAVAKAGRVSAGPTGRPSSQAGSADPYAQIRHNIQTGTGLAGQVMNELGGGGGHMGQLLSGGLAAAGHYLQGRAKAQAPGGGDEDSPGQGQSGTDGGGDQPEGGGTSGLGKKLGAAGAAAAGAAGAYGVIEKGGAMIQGWRNIAATRGGGSGPGSRGDGPPTPVVDGPQYLHRQSRQIYQAMLSEGYSNSSGEDPRPEQYLDFFKTGIKQFAESVDQLTQELRLGRVGHQQVVAPGIISGYNQALKQQVKDNQNGPSLQDYTMMRDQFVSEEIAQGVSPSQAYQNAQQRAAMYANNPAMAGSALQTGNPTGVDLRLHGGPGGTPCNYLPGSSPTRTCRTTRSPEDRTPRPARRRSSGGRTSSRRWATTPAMAPTPRTAAGYTLATCSTRSSSSSSPVIPIPNRPRRTSTTSTPTARTPRVRRSPAIPPR